MEQVRNCSGVVIGTAGAFIQSIPVWASEASTVIKNTCGTLGGKTVELWNTAVVPAALKVAEALLSAWEWVRDIIKANPQVASAGFIGAVGAVTVTLIGVLLCRSCRSETLGNVKDLRARQDDYIASAQSRLSTINSALAKLRDKEKAANQHWFWNRPADEKAELSDLRAKISEKAKEAKTLASQIRYLDTHPIHKAAPAA